MRIPTTPFAGSRPYLGVLCLFFLALACDSEITGIDEKRIGPEGGTAILANGSVRLYVPPGALSEEIWFTVTPAFSVPSSEMFVEGSGWEIGPPGTLFSRPVTLTIAYDPGGVPTGVGENGLGIFKIEGSDWVLLERTSADPGDHSAFADIRNLGRFGVNALSVASLEISPAQLVIEPGESAQFSALPLASNGKNLPSRRIDWTSSDSAVAAVTASGSVRGLGEGTAVITALCGGVAAQAQVLVRVPVASVEVTPTSAVLSLGETLQLSASLRDATGNVLLGREVQWWSSDESVALVDNHGKVTTLSVGSASVTATVEGRHGAATIGVHSPLAVTTNSLAAGVEGEPYSQTLAASGGDGTYLWSLTEGQLPDGFSLDGGTGVISGTPSAAGTATFTARVESADQIADKELSIVVSPVPVSSVEVTPELVTLTPSGIRQLAAVVRDKSGAELFDRTVSWASDDTDIVTVTASGLLTAQGRGSTTVTASVEGHLGWALVVVNGALAVADTALQAGTLGEAYSHTLSAVGGNGQNSWTVLAGSLPPGLDLDPNTGEISGTPTALGMTSFILQVESGDGQETTVSLSIVVNDVVTISTTALPDGSVGEPYQAQLEARGGVGPYLWSVVGDTLPTGITLTEDLGLIKGSPIFLGTVQFTVGVASSDGQVATQLLSLTVHEVPVASVDVSPISATVAVGSTYQLTATARDLSGSEVLGRTVFWVSSNPAVASVDIQGLVTGVGVGSSTVSATVDEASDVATITVYEVLRIQTTTLASGTVGSSYSHALAATGGDGTYGWTLVGGALPAGLTLDGDTGVISGAPAGTGVSTFTAQVVSGGQSATALLTLTVG